MNNKQTNFSVTISIQIDGVGEPYFVEWIQLSNPVFPIIYWIFAECMCRWDLKVVNRINWNAAIELAGAHFFSHSILFHSQTWNKCCGWHVKFIWNSCIKGKKIAVFFFFWIDSLSFFVVLLFQTDFSIYTFILVARLRALDLLSIEFDGKRWNFHHYRITFSFENSIYHNQTLNYFLEMWWNDSLDQIVHQIFK